MGMVLKEHANLVDTPDKFQKLVNMIMTEKRIGFDTESTGLHKEAEIVGFSISVEQEQGYYIPTRHVRVGLFDPQPSNIDPDKGIAALKDMLGREEATIIAHNFQHEARTLRHAGLDPRKDIRATCICTATQSWLGDPSRRKKLEKRVLESFGYQMEEVDFKKERADEVNLTRMTNYASDDARWVLALEERQEKELNRINPQLENVLMNVEMPLIFIVEEMVSHGVQIDTDKLRKIGLTYRDEMDVIEKECCDLIGVRKVSLGSTAWLSNFLIEDLNWWTPVGEKTKQGRWPINEGTIETWVRGKPNATKKGVAFAKHLSRWRRLDKLVGTYVKPILSNAMKRNGRLYANFNPIGTATGRFSSSGPNLQNIPIRTPEGRLIREAFIPTPGGEMYDADFSQIELRIMAHFSGDPVMVKAYREGWDIHQITADSVGCERAHAKAINFGLIYGMGPGTLANRMGVPLRYAKLWHRKFFEKYRGVTAYLRKYTRLCKQRAYADTILGRHRYLEGFRSDDPKKQAGAERLAPNTNIQGSAADLTKLAMIAVDDCFRRLGWGPDVVKMIGQVHDELLFDVVNPNATRDVERIVKECMEGALTLDVPVVADGGIGKNWLEAH